MTVQLSTLKSVSQTHLVREREREREEENVCVTYGLYLHTLSLLLSPLNSGFTVPVNALAIHCIMCHANKAHLNLNLRKRQRRMQHHISHLPPTTTCQSPNFPFSTSQTSTPTHHKHHSTTADTPPQDPLHCHSLSHNITSSHSCSYWYCYQCILKLL